MILILKKIKITWFQLLDLDMMKKLNKIIGLSEIHGVNIGEKWDF